MPPDEYHSGVDNSVYTNVLLRNRSDLSPPQPQHAGAGVPELQLPLSTSAPSLRFAAALARDLGQPVPSQWLEVADRIKVPFDPKHSFHPEFDGYEPGEWTRNPSRAPSGLSQDLVPALDSPAPVSSICPPGEEVKQADVVLLGYPVPFSMSPRVRRRNLEVYEAATSPHGPAMTWVRRLGSGAAVLMVAPPCPAGCGPPSARSGPHGSASSTPEHVRRGLDGAEGAQQGMGPPGKELCQHHGALQGQPPPGPHLPGPSLPPAPASPPAHQPSLTPLGCGVGSPALGHSRVTAWQFPRDLGPPGSRGSGFGRVCVWGPRTDCLAPPQVWTENSDGSGAVNFLTGMGGFLQAALFGFTGFR